MKLLSLCITIWLALICFSACKKEVATPIIETGELVDVEGNTYKTVKVGEDWWLAENLKTKKYKNGTAIALVQASEADTFWSKKNTAACCVVDERFGVYYNWYAIKPELGLAPEGWHVATDEDWMALEKNLGMSNIECEQTGWRGKDISDKLLPQNSVGWLTGEGYVFGNDSCNLHLLPGGCKLFDSRVGDVGISGYWWSPSKQQTETTDYYRNISSEKESVFRYKIDKRYGLTVRCVKNR